jgi:Family of unknown function (DUF6522)
MYVPLSFQFLVEHPIYGAMTLKNRGVWRMVPKPKAVIDFEHGALTIDAAIIGRGLNVEPSLVPVRMREGRITVLCERGYDEDAGRHRLTFFYENRRFRLVVDEEGKAIQRSTVDFGKHPLPTSMRKRSA